MPQSERFTNKFKGKSKIVHWSVESIDRTGKPDYSKCDFSFSSCEYEHENNTRVPLWSMYVNWFKDQEETYVPERNQAFLVSPKKLLQQKQHSPKKKFCTILTNNDMGIRKDVYPRFISLGIENGLLVESRGRYLTNMPPIPPRERSSRGKKILIDSNPVHLYAVMTAGDAETNKSKAFFSPKFSFENAIRALSGLG